jgi:hypothetical protein
MKKGQAVKCLTWTEHRFLLYPRKVVLSDTGNRAYEDVRASVSLQQRRAPQNDLSNVAVFVLEPTPR